MTQQCNHPSFSAHVHVERTEEYGVLKSCRLLVSAQCAVCGISLQFPTTNSTDPNRGVLEAIPEDQAEKCFTKIWTPDPGIVQPGE